MKGKDGEVATHAVDERHHRAGLAAGAVAAALDLAQLALQHIGQADAVVAEQLGPGGQELLLSAGHHPAVDAGLVINPTGIEAQMLGGVMDGIGLALTSSCHLDEGHFLEASWDNYFYTRQWNVPPEITVEIMPSDSKQPGGAGEAGVASSFAAIACAYARATGRMPTESPITHADPVTGDVRAQLERAAAET